jgi:Tfp pilus assembly protein FimT
VRQRGFSMTEVIMIMALLGMILMVAIPGFAAVMERSRLNAALRTVMNDVREARVEATTSGWQYQIVGYASGNDGRANQYRMLGRRSTAVAWPDEDSPAFTSDTQLAGPWVDMGYLFTGVHLEPNNAADDPRFELTFDARGAATMSNESFAPFQLRNEHETVIAFRVSAAGGIRTE